MKRFFVTFNRFLERVSIRVSTTWKLFRYYKLIEAEKSARIWPGVRIRPMAPNPLNLMVKIKEYSSLKYNVTIQGSGEFELGRRSYVGPNSIVGVHEKVTIGDNVMIAEAVSIRDIDHVFDRTDIPMIQQGIKTSPVFIENDVWIGYGVSICKGVTIGKGAIIGAGAVVTKDIPKHAIAVGVPAKVTSYRN